VARCRHGFEPVAVKCPVGCHGPVPALEHASETTQAQLINHTRSVTNRQIVDALNERGSLNAAAEQLGIHPGTIVNRGKADAAVHEAIGVRDPRKTRHTGFINMTGWDQDGWKVIEEVQSNDGTIRWRCRHSCGGVEIVTGIRLRNNPNKYCMVCRPKRPGTVERRPRG
jgi:hypothetical protein